MALSAIQCKGSLNGARFRGAKMETSSFAATPDTESSEKFNLFKPTGNMPCRGTSKWPLGGIGTEMPGVRHKSSFGKKDGLDHSNQVLRPDCIQAQFEK